MNISCGINTLVFCSGLRRGGEHLSRFLEHLFACISDKLCCQMALFPFPCTVWRALEVQPVSTSERRTEVCMYLFGQLGQTLLNGLFKLPMYPNPAPAPSQRQKAEGQMKFSAAFCL